MGCCRLSSYYHIKNYHVNGTCTISFQLMKVASVTNSLPNFNQHIKDLFGIVLLDPLKTMTLFDNRFQKQFYILQNKIFYFKKQKIFRKYLLMSFTCF